MNAQLDLDAERARAFGQAFALLMKRLARECESADLPSATQRGPELGRSQVAREVESEAEELIVRHHVPDAVAEYVRHVLRQGFEADFDPLDPTEAIANRRCDSSSAAAWTASAPSVDGAYAIRHGADRSPVEIARFEGREGGWLVQRWGVADAQPWADLARHGWTRGAEAVPTR